MSMSSLSQLAASLAPIALPLLVHDHPQYAWRGLLIDVARHFIPLEDLRQAVDAMEASKLNVLHLHLSDAQAFPVLLEDTTDLPLSLLAFNGSTRPFGGSGRVYTLADLSELVMYASERGVEVVPEIDMPAHSLSWGRAFPGLLAKCPVFAVNKGNHLTPCRILFI